MNTSATVEHITRRANLWTIVAIAAFVLGISPLVGPLAWWKSRGLREQLRAMGVTNKSSADAAVIVSAVTTGLSVAGYALILLVVIGIWLSPTY